MDPRWRAVADVLTRYSTALQPGERVMIAMHEVDSYPLAQALVAACIECGAFPQVQFFAESMRQSLLLQGNAEQIGWLPEIEIYGMQWADVYFGLRALAGLPAPAGIPAEAIARHQAVQGRVSAMRWQERRAGACCACPPRRWRGKLASTWMRCARCSSPPACWIMSRFHSAGRHKPASCKGRELCASSPAQKQT